MQTLEEQHSLLNEEIQKFFQSIGSLSVKDRQQTLKDINEVLEELIQNMEKLSQDESTISLRETLFIQLVVFRFLYVDQTNFLQKFIIEGEELNETQFNPILKLEKALIPHFQKLLINYPVKENQKDLNVEKYCNKLRSKAYAEADQVQKKIRLNEESADSNMLLNQAIEKSKSQTSNISVQKVSNTTPQASNQTQTQQNFQPHKNQQIPSTQNQQNQNVKQEYQQKNQSSSNLNQQPKSVIQFDNSEGETDEDEQEDQNNNKQQISYTGRFSNIKNKEFEDANYIICTKCPNKKTLKNIRSLRRHLRDIHNLSTHNIDNIVRNLKDQFAKNKSIKAENQENNTEKQQESISAQFQQQLRTQQQQQQQQQLIQQHQYSIPQQLPFNSLPLNQDLLNKSIPQQIQSFNSFNQMNQQYPRQFNSNFH